MQFIGDEELRRIDALSVEELHDELESEFAGINERIVRIAVLVAIYERKGGDITNLRFSGLQLLRRIGLGGTLPSLAMRCWGRQSLLKRLSVLPIPDQEDIEKNNGIKVMELVDGRYETRIRPLDEITEQEIAQAVRTDHLATDAEKMAFIRRRESSQPVDDPMDEAETTERIVLTVGQKKKLKKKAQSCGQTVSEYILTVLRSKRAI